MASLHLSARFGRLVESAGPPESLGSREQNRDIAGPKTREASREVGRRLELTSADLVLERREWGGRGKNAGVVEQVRPQSGKIGSSLVKSRLEIVGSLECGRRCLGAAG
jgi:hypothetical protein